MADAVPVVRDEDRARATFVQLAAWPGAMRVCADPPVYVIPGFLSATECTSLAAAAAPGLHRSIVVDGTLGKAPAPSRTSESCYLTKETTVWLSDRIAALTGKPPATHEPPQVARYTEVRRVAAVDGAAGDCGDGGSGCSCRMTARFLDLRRDVIAPSHPSRYTRLRRAPYVRGSNTPLVHDTSRIRTQGAYYLAHFDAFDLATEPGRECCLTGGQRVATVLMYLNTVAQGARPCGRTRRRCGPCARRIRRHLTGAGAISAARPAQTATRPIFRAPTRYLRRRRHVLPEARPARQPDAGHRPRLLPVHDRSVCAP